MTTELPSPRKKNQVPFRASGDLVETLNDRRIQFADEQKGSKIKPALLSADLVKNLEQTMEKRLQFSKATVRVSDPVLEKTFELQKKEEAQKKEEQAAQKKELAAKQTRHRRTTSLGKNNISHCY